MNLGIDISTYLEELELNNPVFFDKKNNIIDPLSQFRKNGVDFVRLRIWNNPYSIDNQPYLAGTCDVPRMLKLAKLLSKYNFSFMIDFHYSDFWADPGTQIIPKGWKNLTFEELKLAIYEFTYNTLKIFKDENIDVKYVQIGNEITNGMMWPVARIDHSKQDNEQQFDKLATLLKNGIKACNAIMPNAKTIIHLEESYNIEKYDYYLSSLKKRNVIFDILGSSYYPLWHRSMNEYFKCMDYVKEKFQIEVMNVEIAYPFTLKSYDENVNLVINKDIPNLKEIMPYEISEVGQKRFLEDFIKMAKEHDLKGICYWEPLWIKGDKICYTSRKAQIYRNLESSNILNEWANQTLFDYDNRMTLGFEGYKK